MHNLIVLDHPYTLSSDNNIPHHRSFSAALCKAIMEKLARRYETVDLIDLHADGFDPVMSQDDLTNWRLGRPMNPQVANYQERMKVADRVILIFPIWWEQMPAMMKGFCDKVYAKNILYEQSGVIYKSNMKKDVEIVCVAVMGAPSWIFKLLLNNVVARTIHRAVSIRSGIKRFRFIPYCDVNKKSEKKRQEMLENVKI